MSDAPEKDVQMEDEEQVVEEEAANGTEGAIDIEEDEAAQEKKTEDVAVDDKEKEEDKEPEVEEAQVEEAQVEEAPKAPEEPKELEEDAPEDSRPRLADGIAVINSADATPNVITSCEGKILMTLSEGGMQHLLGGARCNIGAKAGRYMFEVTIVELRTSSASGGGGKYQAPSHMLRLGVSTVDSSPLLDGGDGVYFDSEGFFASGGSRDRVGRRWTAHQVLSVVLNLDSDSPNANTISIFCDGERVSPPKAIPETLRGKTLYPTINYKNMMLRVNFGPDVFSSLPFQCRSLQDAAKADTEETARKPKADGVREVLFPVGLPDQGTFAWLEDFLKDKPQYVEVSDRAILSWAEKSSVHRNGGYSWKHCNDHPGWEFGPRELNDSSVKTLLGTMAPLLKRDYLVMEVLGNLLASDRAKALAQFEGEDFKKVAVVVMGEPPKDFKAKVQEKLLEAKKAEAEAEARKAYKAAQQQKKAEPKKEGEEDGDESKKEEKEETLEEAIAKAREAAELTESEKAQWFLKPGKEQDLIQKDLSANFLNFSIPTKEEGFDEIRFVWQKADESSKYLKQWILEQKLTQRVEDLAPGSWFKEKWSEWDKTVKAWKYKQEGWKDGRGPAKPKKEEKKEKKDDMEDGEGDSKDQEEEKKEEEEKEEIIAEDLDVWDVEDVCDVGNGEPLFANFGYEDWVMAGLRFELHLLVHAFKHDMNDPERSSFHEQHLNFYHQKYFRKDLQSKWYGCSSDAALVGMVKDTVDVTPTNSMMECMLADDTPFENFIRLTEDERRERQRRIDDGEEGAALNFRAQRDNKAYGQRSGFRDGARLQGKGAGKPRIMDSGGNRGGNNDRGGGKPGERGGRPGDYRGAGPPPDYYSRGGPPPGYGGPPPTFAGAPGGPRFDSYGRADPRGMPPPGHPGMGMPPPGHPMGYPGYPPMHPYPMPHPAHPYGCGGGGGDYGRDSRHGPPQGPPRSHAPAPSYGGSGYGSQKRGPPPSSMPPSKHSRSDRGDRGDRSPPRGGYAPRSRR